MSYIRTTCRVAPYQLPPAVRERALKRISSSQPATPSKTIDPSFYHGSLENKINSLFQAGYMDDANKVFEYLNWSITQMSNQVKLVQQTGDIRLMPEMYSIHLSIDPDNESSRAEREKAIRNIKSLDDAAIKLQMGYFAEATTLAKEVLENYPTNQEAKKIIVEVAQLEERARAMTYII
jgi:hypothetical protein